MVYDEKLTNRIRKILSERKEFVEKKMFGGISFILEGNMCCGVEKNNLVIRVGPMNYEKALEEPHARPMDFTGRPLRGFVYISPEGYKKDEDLEKWVMRAVEFASSLPAK
jgi:hypothetical protein